MSWSFMLSSGLGWFLPSIDANYKYIYIYRYTYMCYIKLYIYIYTSDDQCVCVIKTCLQKNLTYNHEACGTSSSACGWSWLPRESSKRKVTYFEAPNVHQSAWLLIQKILHGSSALPFMRIRLTCRFSILWPKQYQTSRVDAMEPEFTSKTPMNNQETQTALWRNRIALDVPSGNLI